MIRRTLLAAALAVGCFAATVPAEAAKAPVKLYLNQLSADCNTTQFAITPIAEDADACVFIPRVLVNGQGLASDNEAFTSNKKMKTFRLDASKPVTGTFALFGSSGLKAAEAGAYMKAELTIKIAKKKIGTVTVEGPATPVAPATGSFSLKMPAALNKVLTNSVSVDVNWITCVGLCGVKVSGASFMSIPVR